jgi:hypothetical protein
MAFTHASKKNAMGNNSCITNVIKKGSLIMRSFKTKLAVLVVSSALMIPSAVGAATVIDPASPEAANMTPVLPVTTVTMKMDSMEVDVNGSKTMMDVYPSRKDNFTLIPLRYAADAIGATIAWNEADREATVAWTGHSAVFTVGSDTVVSNGEKKVASTISVMQGDRLMVPVQIFAEVTGWTTDLAEEGKVIRLLSPVTVPIK